MVLSALGCGLELGTVGKKSVANLEIDMAVLHQIRHLCHA
jgi:hypothetical protein